MSDSISIVVKEGEVPRLCVDKPELANCELIVRAQFCNLNDYYADFCCKSCTLDGQLGGQIQENDEEVDGDVLQDGVGEMEPK